LQWYQPKNAYCKNGYLVIEGREEVVPNPYYNPSSGDWRSSSENANYTSACLITKGLQEWGPYGYYEIRARIDTAYGSWPAIWLLGTNNSWPHSGEIDIMEFYRIDKQPTILANLAWGTEVQYKPKWSSSKLLYKEFLEKDKDWHKKFHVWSMSWDENYIKIYIDQELIHETNLNEVQNPDNKNPFAGDNKFYILLNLALGSNGGEPISSELPITYEVDYVRVYQ
jgi:beta-glucanase (GH16 family)